MTEMNDKQGRTFQEIKVRGNQVIERVREVIEEGNARRIIIKKDGRSVMEFPLSVGVGGAAAALLISPTLAAIGAFASLVSDVSIVVERSVPDSEAITRAKETVSPPITPMGE